MKPEEKAMEICEGLNLPKTGIAYVRIKQGIKDCLEDKQVKHEKILSLIEECKKSPPDINAKLDEIKQLIRGE